MEPGVDVCGAGVQYPLAFGGRVASWTHAPPWTSIRGPRIGADTMTFAMCAMLWTLGAPIADSKVAPSSTSPPTRVGPIPRVSSGAGDCSDGLTTRPPPSALQLNVIADVTHRKRLPSPAAAMPRSEFASETPRPARSMTWRSKIGQTSICRTDAC